MPWSATPVIGVSLEMRSAMRSSAVRRRGTDRTAFDRVRKARKPRRGNHVVGPGLEDRVGPVLDDIRQCRPAPDHDRSVRAVHGQSGVQPMQYDIERGTLRAPMPRQVHTLVHTRGQ